MFVSSENDRKGLEGAIDREVRKDRWTFSVLARYRTSDSEDRFHELWLRSVREFEKKKIPQILM